MSRCVRASGWIAVERTGVWRGGADEQPRDRPDDPVAAYDHIGEKFGGTSQELVEFIAGAAVRHQLGDVDQAVTGSSAAPGRANPLVHAVARPLRILKG